MKTHELAMNEAALEQKTGELNLKYPRLKGKTLYAFSYALLFYLNTTLRT